MNMSYSPPLRFGAIIILLVMQSTTIAAAFRVDGQNSPPRSTDIPSIIATPQFDLPILKEESSSSMMTINLVGEVSEVFGCFVIFMMCIDIIYPKICLLLNFQDNGSFRCCTH